MKKLSYILGLILISILAACGPNEGEGNKEFKYPTDQIKICKTNGNCQGCCSWHGGVACYNGISVCADGTPMSSTCQGCISCVGCDPVEARCESDIQYKEGDPYAKGNFFVEAPEFQERFNCEDGDGNYIETPYLPPKEYQYTYEISPIHLTHYGEGCDFPDWYREELAIYFELSCTDCLLDPHPLSKCENYSIDYSNSFRNPFTVHVEMLLRGERHELRVVPYCPDGSCASTFDEDVCNGAEKSGGVDFCEHSHQNFRGFFFFEPYSRENCSPNPCTPQPYSYNEIEAIFINGHRIDMFELR